MLSLCASFKGQLNFCCMNIMLICLSEYSVMYRSGTVASGPNKADLLSAQNGLVGRPLNRSDQDSGFHPTNKRERQVVLDKEMPNPRTINK